MKLIPSAAVEFSCCFGPKEPTKKDLLASGMTEKEFEEMTEADFQYLLRGKTEERR